MKKQLVFVLVFVLCAGAAALPAQAMTVTGPPITLDCLGLSIPDGVIVSYDRSNDDNYADIEHVMWIATDGNGKVLLYYDFTTAAGASELLDSGFLPYDDLPEYNPITLILSSPAGNELPEQIAATYTGSCEGLPWTTPPAQPTIPAGFEQRTITCDVPVYDAPGGKPVGDNALKAGQTWQVNPTPVDGPDGQRWSEVYVGGWQRPFIPTSCVGS